MFTRPIFPLNPALLGPRQVSAVVFGLVMLGGVVGSSDPDASENENQEDEENEPVDSDGDGLFDDEEEELGTDPDSADTDGDGFDDLDEIEAGTNPNYEYSHTYTGDYNVGYCEDGMAEATGPSSSNGHTPLYAAGDVVENFTLTDLYGEDVDLYSFCGQHVMLVFGASWCGPCVDLSEQVQAIQDEYENVQIIEILIEDTRGDPPDQSDLEDWAEHGGFTTVAVVGDGEYNVWPYWEADWGIPSVSHIGPDGTVLNVDGYVTDPGQYLD
jgi:thiol-disulfide isomerase/thioredoxin